MRIVEARTSDSDRLKEFFENSVLPGRISLRFQRHTDFFDIYRIQSSHFKTFILESDDGEVHGCATLTFRQGYINGKAETIGFARDLRLSKNRKALLEWPLHFEPVLNREMKENDCRFFFSVISEKERDSYSAFIRPKAIRGSLPRYYMLRKFQLISIHGRLPFASKPLGTIRLEQGNDSMVEELAEYLDRKATDRPLAPVFQADSFYRQLQSWPNMTPQSFVIARDKNGKIIGCCAPWTSGDLQTIIVENYGPITSSVQKLFYLGSKLQLTRPLARQGHPFNICYLTHLFADNPDIFFSLIDHVWRASEKSHTLVYPHYSGHYQTLPPSAFLHTKTPYGVYTVLPPRHQLPDFLRPRLQSPPPFVELPLI